MTNQTTVLSVIGVTLGTADITTPVNNFIVAGIANGCTNFEILPVVVNPENHSGAPTDRNWYTVQINYYDPGVQEG